MTAFSVIVYTTSREDGVESPTLATAESSSFFTAGPLVTDRNTMEYVHTSRTCIEYHHPRHVTM